jgi:hypothetical protein
LCLCSGIRIFFTLDRKNVPASFTFEEDCGSFIGASHLQCVEHHFFILALRTFFVDLDMSLAGYKALYLCSCRPTLILLRLDGGPFAPQRGWKCFCRRSRGDFKGREVYQCQNDAFRNERYPLLNMRPCSGHIL